MTELWPGHRWQAEVPDEKKDEVAARFRKAGLKITGWSNHVPEFDGVVDWGLAQGIAEGSLTRQKVTLNETIPDAPVPVQSPSKKPKKRTRKGGA